MAQKRPCLVEIDEKTNCPNENINEIVTEEEEDDDFEFKESTNKKRVMDYNSNSSTSMICQEVGLCSTSNFKDQGGSKNSYFSRGRKQVLALLPNSPLKSSSSAEEDIGEEIENDSHYYQSIRSHSVQLEVLPSQKRLKLSVRSEDLFSYLPEEMILRILKLLPQKCLGRITQVSKQFRRLTQDESLWRRMDLIGKFISSTSMNVLLSRKPVYLRLSGATVLEQISLKNELVAPQLIFLDLSAVMISKPVLVQFLRMCSSLKKLSLENTEINKEILVSMEIFAHSIDTLNLTMCSGIDVEILCGYFGKCKMLTTLSMGCIKQSWTKEDFLKVVTCLPRELQQLNISGFRNILIDAHVDIMVERCENLLELDCSDSSELTSVAVETITRLKELQHLALTRCYGIHASAYALLVPMKFLRHLEIFSLFKEPTIIALKSALPKVIINSCPFSTIARPTVRGSKSSIWSQRVRN